MRNPLRPDRLALLLAAAAFVIGPLIAVAVDGRAENRAGDNRELITTVSSEVDIVDDELDDLTALNESIAGLVARGDRTDELLARIEERLVEVERRLDELDRRVRTVTGARATASSTSTRSSAAAAPAGLHTGDRWDALAACESTGDMDGRAPHVINDSEGDGGMGNYRGAFQWAPSTWDGANGRPMAERSSTWAGAVSDPAVVPYHEELRLAQAWAARDDVDARGQWPTCWPKVMGDTPR